MTASRALLQLQLHLLDLALGDRGYLLGVLETGELGRDLEGRVHVELPDGGRLAYSDKNGKLWVVDVETRERIEIADQRNGLIGEFGWSPKGGHIALSLNDDSGFGSIWVWSRAEAGFFRVELPG